MGIDLSAHAALIYAVTAVLALHVAVTGALARRSAHPRIQGAAALLTVIAVVAVAFAIADAAPLIGPVFGLVGGAAAVLLAPLGYVDHQALLAEPYWRRVVLLTFHRRALDAR